MFIVKGQTLVSENHLLQDDFQVCCKKMVTLLNPCTFAFPNPKIRVRPLNKKLSRNTSIGYKRVVFITPARWRMSFTAAPLDQRTLTYRA